VGGGGGGGGVGSAKLKGFGINDRGLNLRVLG
jgi:hypothetical protein